MGSPIRFGSVLLGLLPVREIGVRPSGVVFYCIDAGPRVPLEPFGRPLASYPALRLGGCVVLAKY